MDQKYETKFVSAFDERELTRKVGELEAEGWMFISFQVTAVSGQYLAEWKYPFLCAALRRELLAPTSTFRGGV